MGGVSPFSVEDGGEGKGAETAYVTCHYIAGAQKCEVAEFPIT